jgi:hypothetical protein
MSGIEATSSLACNVLEHGHLIPQDCFTETRMRIRSSSRSEMTGIIYVYYVSSVSDVFVGVFSHKRAIISAPSSSRSSHTTFFSSHCCQSSLEKPLEMPPSTMPCSEVSVSSLQQERLTSSHIEQNSRCYMDTGQAVGFCQQLDVVRDLIAAVQASVWTWLVRDFEEAVDFLLVNANAAS